MAKSGTFIQVPSSQEGATPRLVTETEPLPVSVLDAPDRVDELLISSKASRLLLEQIRDEAKVQSELMRQAFSLDTQIEDIT